MIEMKPIVAALVAEILFVQTHNGTVSIVKDLTEHECRIAACQLELDRTCLPKKCDGDGNLVSIGDMHSCTGNILGPTPTRIECLK